MPHAISSPRMRFWPGWSLESSGPLRLFTVFLLYAGQGIPLGLFDFAIPAWMAVNGASAADIGFLVAMSALPWSFKFIAGFLIDRYAILPMGRRRSWIIGAQAVIVAFLIIFAILDPGAQDVILLGMVALAVNTAVVFQDVAVDALTVDILQEKERAIGGSLASGGQVLGIAASASLAGLIVYSFGAGAAYVVCAGLVLVVTAHLIWLTERKGERRLPWTHGETHPFNLEYAPEGWLPMLKATLRNTFAPISLAWIPVIMVKGLVYGVCLVFFPLVASQYAGWSEADIGSVNGTAQLVAGIVAIAIGGFFVAKIGAQRAMLLFTLCSIGLLTWMLTSQSAWADPGVITIFGFGWTIIYVLGGIGQVVIIMRLSPPRIAAAQYSIYMAFSNMGISIAGIVIAAVAIFSTPQGMLMLLIGGQVLAALILLVVKFPIRQIGRSSEPHAQTTSDPDDQTSSASQAARA